MVKNLFVIRGILPLPLLFVLAIFGACAGAFNSYNVTTTCAVPAATHIAARTIALANFSGKHGEEIRNRVYGKLADTKYFTLVDRNQSNIDIALGQEMELDPRYLEQLRGVHADAVITGNVLSELKDTNGYDKTSKGKRKPFTTRQAMLRLDFKVFDLRSGKLLAGDSISKLFEKKYGGIANLGELLNSGPKSLFSKEKLPLASETMDELIDTVAKDMVSEITPTQRPCTFALAGDKKNNMVKKGNEFAKRGVMDSAREMWEEALAADSSNPAAIHNIGVYYETMGNLESLKKAEDQYHRATKLSDDTFYIDALSRIQGAIKMRTELEKQQKQKRQKSGMAGGNDSY